VQSPSGSIHHASSASKVTPGVGCLWFAFRQEWRNLAIAVGVTAAIVLGSLIIYPRAWLEWAAVLSTHDPTPGLAVPVPVRLAAAVALLWWGARSDRRWVVPVAAFLGLPLIRTTGWVLLVAVIPLLRLRRTSDAS